MKKIILILFAIGFLTAGYAVGKYGVTRTNLPEQKKVSVNNLSETCPYHISNFPEKYTDTFFSDKIQITHPPVLISPTPKVSIIDKFFDPKKPDEVWHYWKDDIGQYQGSDDSPWHEKDFDVDEDGKPERILTASVAMTHSPHVLEIVKNNRIIFLYNGADIDANATYYHNGFFLSETSEFGDGVHVTTRKTRYNFDAGKFVPVWYQDSCAII